MKTKIGTIGVDAGLIWVGDPCYIMGGDSSHGVKRWDDFCGKLDNGKPVNEPLGAGIGFAIESNFGDGEYPVYVEIGKDGRPKKIVIELE